MIYRFKVLSRNVVGFSMESSELLVRAAAIPDTPDAPVVSQSGDNIEINWSAPYNGGSAITHYNIYIRQSDQVTYSEELVNCNGQESVVI